MNEISEKIGNGFSGEVFLVKYEDSDKFYDKNRSIFTDVGSKCFLKALTIPPTFFQERSMVLQGDLLTDTKISASNKKHTSNILLLVIDDLICFASPKNESVGWESPEVLFGLDLSIYNPIDFDVKSGYCKYFLSAESIDPNEYVPGMFLRVPIFYGKPILMDFGMYRVRSEASFSDPLFSSQLAIKPSLIDEDFFKKMSDFVFSKLTPLFDAYKLVIEKTSDSTIDNVFEYLLSMREDTAHKVPRRIINSASKHNKILRRGKEAPQNSPSQISTLYDLMETFSFYSAGSKNPMMSKYRTDKSIFEYFIRKTIDEINIKNLVPDADLGRILFRVEEEE